MSIEFFETLAKFAPLATTVIALVAALVALRAIYVQRDTARRRTAVDFFLKSETDEGLIQAYNEFRHVVPQVPAMVSRPTLSHDDPDYQTLRKWLNLCELISVGVNLKAFSDRVSYEYWGDVIPETFRDAELLIRRIRRTPGLGGPRTLCELENLSMRWSERTRRRRQLRFGFGDRL